MFNTNRSSEGLKIVMPLTFATTEQQEFLNKQIFAKLSFANNLNSNRKPSKDAFAKKNLFALFRCKDAIHIQRQSASMTQLSFNRFSFFISANICNVIGARWNCNCFGKRSSRKCRLKWLSIELLCTMCCTIGNGFFSIYLLFLFPS